NSDDPLADEGRIIANVSRELHDDPVHQRQCQKVEVPLPRLYEIVVGERVALRADDPGAKRQGRGQEPDQDAVMKADHDRPRAEAGDRLLAARDDARARAERDTVMRPALADLMPCDPRIEGKEALRSRRVERDEG